MEQQLHINVLELLAVLRALQSFHHHCQGRRIQVQTDNTTAVAFFTERWRNALQKSTERRLGDLPFLPETPDSPDVSAHSGEAECRSRCPIPSPPTTDGRMDHATRRLQSPLSALGMPGPRPVCDDLQQTSPGVRLPSAAPANMGDGRPHYGPERFARIPLPAFRHATSSPAKDTEQPRRESSFSSPRADLHNHGFSCCWR